ncbi:hypothetical protein DXG01_008620 [Tephrocybe rancida]|nr:hypothetical protein DXG01_008620 [Tephrocybe rancida]
MAGKKACDLDEHQEIERVHFERGQASFQLKERLACSLTAHTDDAVVSANIDYEDIEDEETFAVVDGQVTLSTATQDEGKKKIWAQFGRKRTHNEQIIVAPCGMILACETFFGAETVPSVVEMVKRTFRIHGRMPNHILFDNNCTLAKHVKGDPVFKNVGLSVDVFHFKCKHSENNLFCQCNCNPASFPELLGEEGKGWFFNSSIAEQTNVWLGGYQAICREMRPDKYDFFLDQMILQRNEMTRAKLEKQGRLPQIWPMCV